VREKKYTKRKREKQKVCLIYRKKGRRKGRRRRKEQGAEDKNGLHASCVV
jgi:hypothetical protein